jgi:oxygen-independent coproporphyrinogen-3 oxidase
LRAPRPIAVYVHFPWCLAKCPYCDFTSYATPASDIDHDGYADAVISELTARTLALGDASPEIGSIFFGGGTPSLWRATSLGRVLRAIESRFKWASPREITVECNPTSLDKDVAEALADQGVTRLSIGAQALRTDQLRFLGRLHDAAGAREAIRAALGSSIPRVSADMIFGLPDQTPDDACAQAEALASMGLYHLSCYQLTIEPGTKFGELAKRGRLPRAEDGIVAEAFLAIDAALSSRGLSHYEISNYAKPGEEARHNLAYWHGDQYLGLGCGAVGFVRSLCAGAGGIRYRNTTDPRRYVDAAPHAAPIFGEGDPLSIENEELEGRTLLCERIMLGLRLQGGLNLAVEAEDLGVPPWTKERERAAALLVARGRLERDSDRIRIPAAAWLWTDDTAARLF